MILTHSRRKSGLGVALAPPLRLLGTHLSFVLALLATMPCAAQTITSLNTVGGWADYTTALAISADGTAVVGEAGSFGPGNEASFRWKLGSGLENISGPSGWPLSSARAVSADGAVVAGNFYSGSGGVYLQYRWVEGGGEPLTLGNLCNCGWASGTAVSANGAIVFGTSAGPGWRITRWAAGTGLQNYGTVGLIDATAWGASGDGATVVGFGTGGAPNYYDTAYRWQPFNGPEYLTPLFGLPNARALAVSSDGVVPVGGCVFQPYTNPETWRATRWISADSPEDLGVLYGQVASQALGVSPNGDVVVGYSPTGTNGAWLWTQTRGITHLATFLANSGVNLANWSSLDTCVGVSADGTAVAGTGVYVGKSRAFIVRGLAPLCGPWILEQPQDVTVCQNGTTSLNVTAFGPTFHNPSFHWEKWNDSFWVPLSNGTANGTVISGATSPSLSLANCSPINVPGYYRCIITAGCSSLASATVLVSMINQIASFQDDGLIPTACSHGSATMSSYPGPPNLGPFAYQWQRETAPLSNVWVNLQNGLTGGWDGNPAGIGGIVSGANTAALTIAANTGNGRQLATIHARRYRCVVTNPCGDAFDTPKSLSVILVGDANCSGAINNFDIDPFVASIFAGNVALAPASYLAVGATQACWDFRGCWADLNHDTLPNNFDIDPFVSCIFLNLPAGKPCP